MCLGQQRQGLTDVLAEPASQVLSDSAMASASDDDDHYRPSHILQRYARGVRLCAPCCYEPRARVRQSLPSRGGCAPPRIESRRYVPSMPHTRDLLLLLGGTITRVSTLNVVLERLRDTGGGKLTLEEFQLPQVRRPRGAGDEALTLSWRTDYVRIRPPPWRNQRTSVDVRSAVHARRWKPL